MDMASLSLCPRISLSTLHSQAGSSILAVQRFSMGGLGSGSERFSRLRSSGKLLRLCQASQKFRNRGLAMPRTSTPVIGNPNSLSFWASFTSSTVTVFLHLIDMPILDHGRERENKLASGFLGTHFLQDFSDPSWPHSIQSKNNLLEQSWYDIFPLSFLQHWLHMLLQQT
jgi:hypothetical protein